MYTHPTQATWNTDKPRSGSVGRPGPRVSSLPRPRGARDGLGVKPLNRGEEYNIYKTSSDRQRLHEREVPQWLYLQSTQPVRESVQLAAPQTPLCGRVAGVVGVAGVCCSLCFDQQQQQQQSFYSPRWTLHGHTPIRGEPTRFKNRTYPHPATQPYDVKIQQRISDIAAKTWC